MANLRQEAIATMKTSFTAATAGEHNAELGHGVAGDHRGATPALAHTSHEHVIALRVAQPEDDYDVSRLAQLDDAQPPVAPVMLAVVDGEAVAALSLSDGRVVANPFVATEKVVSLLRLRATQLSGERRHRWWARVGRGYAERHELRPARQAPPPRQGRR
jgi:hypothetical protein